MIVKFFTRGTGGSKGVFDYLLKDKEQPDGKRLDVEVLRGDIDNQALLIEPHLHFAKQLVKEAIDAVVPKTVIHCFPAPIPLRQGVLQGDH